MPDQRHYLFEVTDTALFLHAEGLELLQAAPRTKVAISGPAAKAASVTTSSASRSGR